MWGNLDDMNDGKGGFLDESQFKADPERVDKSKRVQNIIPLMIGHLLKAKGDVQIWEMPTRTIAIVGILIKMEHATTKITYEIEDETGSITAFRWLEADKTPADYGLEMNTYVKVFGFLREQNDKKHILAVKIVPLRDLNELTNHLLEVTYVTLKCEKLANKGTVSDMYKQESGTVDEVSGLTRDQTVVFKIIQAQNDTDNGIQRDELKRRVPPNILPQVDGIIDFLTSEGHIYTTLTDDHFKTT